MLISISLASGLSLVLFKWIKAFLVVILLEVLTILVISLMLLASSGLYFLTTFVFTFFVSEALILLSAMYGALRLNGIVNSSMVFF